MLLSLDLRPAQVGVMLSRLSTLNQKQTYIKKSDQIFSEYTYFYFWVFDWSRRELISCAHRLISKTINIRGSRLLRLELDRYLEITTN